MFKKTMIILATVFLISGGSNALANHGHHGHGGHGENLHHGSHAMHEEHAAHGIHNGIHLPGDKVMKEWGFDEELIETLHNLQSKFDSEAIDLEADLKKAELELNQAHQNDRVKESELHKAIDKFFEAKADLMKLYATAGIEGRKAMGEENFNKIREAHSN